MSHVKEKRHQQVAARIVAQSCEQNEEGGDRCQAGSRRKKKIADIEQRQMPHAPRSENGFGF